MSNLVGCNKGECHMVAIVDLRVTPLGTKVGHDGLKESVLCF